ncbi:MAG: RNA polymerase sigma factor [Pseudonocardiaceae bacterium]
MAARAGDGTAWDEIVRRYSGVVAAKVRSFRLQDADAFDAMQMTWLRLAENVHRLCYPERLAGWLATTASRECLRILRQAKSTATPVEVLATHVADPAPGPEQCAVEADTARALGRLIAQLPPTRRILLRALFADDAGSYTDVAQTVGIPVGSIGPSRARALQQLRWMLAERGLGPSA